MTGPLFPRPLFDRGIPSSDVLAQYRWPFVADLFRAGLARDPYLFRRVVSGELPPPGPPRDYLMASVWVWHALQHARAIQLGLAVAWACLPGAGGRIPGLSLSNDCVRGYVGQLTKSRRPAPLAA